MSESKASLIMSRRDELHSLLVNTDGQIASLSIDERCESKQLGKFLRVFQGEEPKSERPVVLLNFKKLPKIALVLFSQPVHSTHPLRIMDEFSQVEIGYEPFGGLYELLDLTKISEQDASFFRQVCSQHAIAGLLGYIPQGEKRSKCVKDLKDNLRLGDIRSLEYVASLFYGRLEVSRELSPRLIRYLSWDTFDQG